MVVRLFFQSCVFYIKKDHIIIPSSITMQRKQTPSKLSIFVLNLDVHVQRPRISLMVITA